jgi:hypothetical protein
VRTRCSVCKLRFDTWTGGATDTECADHSGRTAVSVRAPKEVGSEANRQVQRQRAERLKELAEYRETLKAQSEAARQRKAAEARERREAERIAREVKRLEDRRAMEQQARKERRDGRCTRCGVPVGPLRWYCDECRVEAKRDTERRYRPKQVRDVAQRRESQRVRRERLKGTERTCRCGASFLRCTEGADLHRCGPCVAQYAREYRARRAAARG